MNNISDFEAHKRDEEFDAAEDRRKERLAQAEIPPKYRKGTAEWHLRRDQERPDWLEREAGCNDE